MSLIKALRAYQQADEDGVMCIVSRQAVDEAADEIERLRDELQDMKSELSDWRMAHNHRNRIRS